MYWLIYIQLPALYSDTSVYVCTYIAVMGIVSVRLGTFFSILLCVLQLLLLQLHVLYKRGWCCGKLETSPGCILFKFCFYIIVNLHVWSSMLSEVSFLYPFEFNTFTWWPYCLYETSQDMYKKAAEFWAELRVELLSASAFLNDKPNTSQLWRLYWASHQVLIFKWCLKTQSLFWCVTCPDTKHVLGSVAFL